MSLNFRQLRYFIAAAETGQISAAAAEMNISQSAVTASVQSLERMLGAKLLSRSAHGVSLTPEGQQFLIQARAVMAAVNEAVRSPLGEMTRASGRVRLGVSYTVSGYFMARHHSAFRRSHPEITLELHEMDRHAVEQALIDDALDMAVILTSNLENEAELQHETLFRSHRRLWLPTEHPLLIHEAVPLAEIAKQPYIMLTVDEAHLTQERYWEKFGLKPNVIFTTSSIEGVRSMVAAGMGVAILSDMVYRPWSLEGQRIEQRRVIEGVPSMDVGLTWPRHRPVPAPARILRTFLTTTFGRGA